jgi:hypothetical protein
MDRSHGLRVAASALLAAEALLVVHPVLAVSNTFVGAGLLGKAIAYVRIPEVMAQGPALLASPALVIALLVAGWAVARGGRGIGALLLQPLVAAVGAVPFLTAMSTTGWRWTPFAAAAVTTVVLVGVARVGGRPTPGWWRVWAAYGLVVVLLAGFGATSRALPWNPTALLADPGAEDLPPGPDLPPPDVPQNPALAANPFNSIHHDAWATDAYALPAPSQPLTADVDSFYAGGDCATITVDSRGRLVTLCSSLTRVVAYVLDPADLSVLESRVVGERRLSLTDFSGGGYFVLDADDRIVFPARGGVLRVIGTGPGLPEDRAVDVSATLRDGEQVTSVLPDWRGRYWYVGSLGTVGLVRGERVEAVNLGGEDIENSFAVAREGVYVVTGAAMYQLRAGAYGPPRVVWRTEYDVGTVQKPGQTSRASGTTPTVFGPWVAIADNASPRMNVVVFDRRTGRSTCSQPVFKAGASATENALIAIDDTLIVENNHGYAPALSSTSAGRSTEPGLAAIAVEPDGRCRLRWENRDIHIPSVVSKATSVGGLVLTYTKPPNRAGVDAWYFTGVDVRTGRVAWTRRAGAGGAFNNHYAAAYLNGDMFVGTLNGIVVLRR